MTAKSSATLRPTALAPSARRLLRHVEHATYYLLPATCYPHPTTYYLLLPTTDTPLPTTCCVEPTTSYYLLPTHFDLLQTAYYLLPSTDSLLHTTWDLLPDTEYRLHTTNCRRPTSYCPLPSTDWVCLPGLRRSFAGCCLSGDIGEAGPKYSIACFNWRLHSTCTSPPRPAVQLNIQPLKD